MVWQGGGISAKRQWRRIPVPRDWNRDISVKKGDVLTMWGLLSKVGMVAIVATTSSMDHGGFEAQIQDLWREPVCRVLSKP